MVRLHWGLCGQLFPPHGTGVLRRLRRCGLRSLGWRYFPCDPGIAIARHYWLSKPFLGDFCELEAELADLLLHYLRERAPIADTGKRINYPKALGDSPGLFYVYVLQMAISTKKFSKEQVV